MIVKLLPLHLMVCLDLPDAKGQTSDVTVCRCLDSRVAEGSQGNQAPGGGDGEEEERRRACQG